MELGFEIGDKVKMVDSRYLRESIGTVGEVILIKDIDDDGDIEVIIKPDNSQGERLYYVGNWGDVLEKVEEEIQENSIGDIDIDTARQTYKIWEAIEMLSRDRDLIFESIGALGDNVRLLIVDDLKDGFGATSEYGIAFQFANEENSMEMFVNHFWIKSEWTLVNSTNKKKEKSIENKGGCYMLNIIFEKLRVVDKEAWDGNDGEMYRLTKEGCLERFVKGAGWLEDCLSYKKLLSGELKPMWKPKVGETYYMPEIFYIRGDMKWSSSIWDNDDIDKHRLGLNMVFKTKEEAIKRSEEIIEILKGNK